LRALKRAARFSGGVVLATTSQKGRLETPVKRAFRRRPRRKPVRRRVGFCPKRKAERAIRTTPESLRAATRR
jgi:hypothetical protein